MPALWTSQTFEAPFTDDLIVSSDSFPVANKNSLEVIVMFEDFSPEADTAAVNYRLQTIIERELATDVWIPIMAAFKRINGMSDPRQHVLTVTPIFNIDPGTVILVDQGGKNRIALSPFNASMAELGNVRVSVFAHRIVPTEENDLEEVILTGYYRLYDV